MQITQQKKINEDYDLILPLKKDADNSQLIKEHTGLNQVDFEGNLKEFLLLYGPKGKRIFLLGLGDAKQLSQAHEAFKSLAFKMKAKWSGQIQVDCRHLVDSLTQSAVLGIQLATYDIGLFKSDEGSTPFYKEDFELVIVSESIGSTSLKEGQFTGESINEMKRLIDTPSNTKTPEFLADWAKKSAEKYGYNCEVLEKSALEKQGLHALLAVGQGSMHEPRLIINTYNPNNTDTPDIALIGKGITFDTGGLSIKPSQNLHYMKSDMGGSAVVLGTVELIAKLKLPLHVVGVVASAENAVDANSIRPGDVINSYAGKTIEVIDTDAEGRLVLADAISYVLKNKSPKRMIDLATLTGSVVRTLGYGVAGMFTNNQEMADQLYKIGLDTHERVWKLPLFEDYEEDLHSDVADVRNFNNKPVAGAINAAKFLEYFTESHKNWVHLDIAGVSLGDSEYSKMKSATGFGVRLITEYLKSLTN